MHNNSTHKLITLFVLISFTLTVSCSATKVHPLHTALPQEQARDIKKGDTVKITTHSGEQYKFKVERITHAGIEGNGIQLAYSEIDRIKKVRLTGSTIAIVAGIIVLVAGLVFIASKADNQGDRAYGTVNTAPGEGK